MPQHHLSWISHSQACMVAHSVTRTSGRDIMKPYSTVVLYCKMLILRAGVFFLELYHTEISRRLIVRLLMLPPFAFAFAVGVALAFAVAVLALFASLFLALKALDPLPELPELGPVTELNVLPREEPHHAADGHQPDNRSNLHPTETPI